MYTMEIPREDWDRFLNIFSRDHQGQRVTVEIMSGDLGDQPAAQDAPLLGLTFDTKNSEGQSIDVMLGDSPADLTTHVIPEPSRVQLAKTESGMDQALQIESAGGPTTLLRFGSPGEA